MTDPTTIDTLFRTLSHAYRRYAIRCLHEHGSMTLADLADEVAARAYERPIDDVPADDVERLYLSLYHTHLPLLGAADMVTFDPSRATVTIGEAAERALPFLSLADNEAANPA